MIILNHSKKLEFLKAKESSLQSILANLKKTTPDLEAKIKQLDFNIGFLKHRLQADSLITDFEWGDWVIKLNQQEAEIKCLTSNQLNTRNQAKTK